MALSQKIENGKPVDTSASGNASTDKSSKAENKATSGLGKDAFLQLLVAQMRYQDPLKPTDNTEYVAQLATFSQLEATQNLGDTMTKNMGSDLVGKYVIIKDSSGYLSGRVDYTMIENGEVYLAVKDKLYSIEDLDSIINPEYYEASELVGEFNDMMAKLPKVDRLTLVDEKSIIEARKYFDAMTKYQQGFVSQENIDLLEKLEAKMGQMKGETFTGMVNKLPKIDDLTLEDEKSLIDARKFYDEMSKYQQGFVKKEDLELFEKLEAKMKELKENK